jgi:hypothetical protein
MNEHVVTNCNDDCFNDNCSLIYYGEKFDEFGIIIHDGGNSFLEINYCPWCGKRLPQSKRNRWFDELEKLGYETPLEMDIPNEYKSSKWYKK